MIEKSRILLSGKKYMKFPVGQFFEQVREAGFEKVEVLASSPHIFTDAYGVGDLNSLRQRADVSKIKIECYRPVPYGYALYAETGSLLRKSSLDYYCNCIEAAAELGAPMMAIEIPCGQLDLDKEQQRELIAEGLWKLAEKCAQMRMALVWKRKGNQQESSLDCLKETRILYDLLVDCPAKPGVELDVSQTGKEEIKFWFDSFGKNILYVSGLDLGDSFAEEAESLGYTGYYGQDL